MPTAPPLMIRSLSALVLAPVVLSVVYIGGVWFQALVAVAAVIALYEWLRLCRHGSIAPVERAAWLLVGGLYITSAFLCIWLLRGEDAVGRNIVFLLLACVWAADTGAYMAGTMIGGPKLAPRISPKKTWAGLIGALLAAAIAAVAFSGLFPESTAQSMGLTGIIVGGVSQVGDLAESLAKRRFGVKDSGAIIPGHGGILDRVDGLMAAALIMGLVLAAKLGGSTLWF